MALNVYLDASLLVPLFIQDRFTARAQAFLSTGELVLHVSDFAETEFASVMSLKVRKRDLTREEALGAFAAFDLWKATEPNQEFAETADIQRAGALLRRLDLNLRAPDAIHIAIALRAGAALATFDSRMAECAEALGLALAPA